MTCRWPPALVDWFSGDPTVICPDDQTAEMVLRNRLLGILTSHPERNAFRAPSWQQSLDATLEQAKQNSEIVLFPCSAPYASTIRYACERYGVMGLAVSVRIAIPPLLAQQQNATPGQLELCCSTPLSGKQASPEDQAVCVLADRLVALQVSPKGKIASLLERRLACKEIDPTSVWLHACIAPRRTVSMCQNRFSQLGAVLWFPKPLNCHTHSPWACKNRFLPPTLQLSGHLPEPLRESQDYLVHSTRARQTHWPDQSDQALLSETFRLAWNPAPTPLETLLRIVSEQRLIATTNLKRGTTPTISFTENSLATLQNMRTFQSHLARWDWEPYGIAIRKSKLSHLRCKPVRYLSRDQIDRLEPDDQSYCQPLPLNATDRDWTCEREWRLADDLRLVQVGSNEAFVFVAYHWEARLLAHYSRWPVYALENSTRLSG